MSPVRIDAHQHFWQLSSGLHDWPGPNLPVIYRDFTPQDLQPLLRQHSVAGTVLVQAAPTLAETQAQLALAAQHDWVLGVVGWVDLSAPEAVQQLRELARQPKLKSIRPMLQGLAQDDWILTQARSDAIQTLIELDLAFDALVLPRHLPHLLRFAQSWPALRMVIDHAAKPELAQGASAAWLRNLQALGKLPQVHCKLSGLMTEAGLHWQAQGLRDCAQLVLQCFGAHRLMWGSDWPVLNLVADYGAWVQLCEDFSASLSAADQAAFWGGTAQAFYKLQLPAFSSSSPL